jgi:hypothetical protein
MPQGVVSVRRRIGRHVSGGSCECDEAIVNSISPPETAGDLPTAVPIRNKEGPDRARNRDLEPKTERAGFEPAVGVYTPTTV